MAMGEYERLVNAYRKGDEAALERLVRSLRRPLYGFIYHMTEGRDDADDIFQETWRRAIARLSHFRAGNFRAWLFRIAHNLVIDRARQNRLLTRPDEDSPDQLALLADKNPTPDQQAVISETARRIAEAVSGLPPGQREVFVLRTKGNLSFREIAAIQGTSINTALGRMRYAIQRLRRELLDLRPDTGEDGGS
ncbi:MAG TPA: sigma-70 family RNA polymerase sigma factor [Kiritimatiellae bacterium]|nr:sigma-70 family RNA polymerase sigma factor [Kiritimatiellia bacterium]